MAPPQYGLIAYVNNPLGQFVEDLCLELQPEEAGSMAHLSVLPPRPLMGSEAEALEMIEDLCRDVNPFEVSMGDAESFMPRTPTVFIRVAHGAYRMRELHDRLNRSVLQFEEPYPYMPHLTIFRFDDAERSREALAVAQNRWEKYDGPRRLLIEQLVFVRGSREAGWLDVAPIPLGRRMAPTVTA